MALLTYTNPFPRLTPTLEGRCLQMHASHVISGGWRWLLRKVLASLTGNQSHNTRLILESSLLDHVYFFGTSFHWPYKISQLEAAVSFGSLHVFTVNILNLLQVILGIFCYQELLPYRSLWRNFDFSFCAKLL
jgi:hypothetical protein